MGSSLKKLFLALAIGLDFAAANNAVSDWNMRNDHMVLAKAGAADWHFNKGEWCYPTAALNNGQQMPWGIGGCPNEGSSDRAPDFPTYFFVSPCWVNGVEEYRVMYNVYFPYSTNIWSGHTHDWEYYVLVWKRWGNDWYRSRIILEAHGKHTKWNWADYPSSVTENDRTWRREADQPVIYFSFDGHGLAPNQNGYQSGKWYWGGDWLENAWNFPTWINYDGTSPPHQFWKGGKHDLCGAEFN